MALPILPQKIQILVDIGVAIPQISAAAKGIVFDGTFRYVSVLFQKGDHLVPGQKAFAVVRDQDIAAPQMIDEILQRLPGFPAFVVGGAVPVIRDPGHTTQIRTDPVVADRV